MEEVRSIGALARAAGVPTTTVRYYERCGLLAPAARSRAGYRQYGQESVEQLRFIRAAQACGFTLEDIRELLDVRAERTVDVRRCEGVQSLIITRLTEVERKLAELEAARQWLRDSLAACRMTRPGCMCPVVERLGRPEPARPA